MNVAVHPERINIISLCTGGGGLDLGVELAMPSARSVVLVEREAFAASQLVSAISQGLLAEAALWSDVTTFNGRPWRGIVDGIIGGIPCQPHSLAGKRQGEEDERDLWSDARRIIVQSGAWFVLIENVRGMVSSGGAERVWRDLRRLGFEVEGGLFTASEVGASHERERVFILAVADTGRSEWRAWRQFPGRPGGTYTQSAGPSNWLPRSVVADTGDARLQGCELSQSSGEWHRSEASRPTPELCGASLVDATCERWGEGWPQPIVRSGWDAAASTDDAVGYAIGSGHDRRQANAVGRPFQRTIVEGPGQCVGLFPPGPSDLSRWASVLASTPELEPAFRRVADGLASRLDVARVDRLRMLGNGVVCLEGAYAFRTLATRLAASGSSGAARLVRAMELAT